MPIFYVRCQVRYHFGEQPILSDRASQNGLLRTAAIRLFKPRNCASDAQDF